MSKPNDQTDTSSARDVTGGDSLEINADQVYGELEHGPGEPDEPSLDIPMTDLDDFDSDKSVNESDSVADDRDDDDFDSDDQQWDRNRQDRDQAISTLRKDNESLRAENQQLLQRMDDLTSKVDKLTSGNSTEQTKSGLDSLDDIFGDDSDDLIDFGIGDQADDNDELGDLEIDEFADESDKTELLNRLVKEAKASKQKEVRARNKRALDNMISAAVTEVGEDSRNEIVTEVISSLKADGYSKDKLPTPQASKYIILAAARKVALTHNAAAKPSPKPKPKSTKQDTADSGAAPPKRRGMRTLNEAVEEMVREGRL